MGNTSKEQHDAQEGYCPMLGHWLTFSYCRTMNKGLPCFRVLNCWFETFAIQQFIAEQYTHEEQGMIFTPPKPKLPTLLELIEQAQERAAKTRT
ncbi:MAG: hypothetical protein H8E79_01895 [Desulfobulbaceae bacterium]|uniref:Uncharacterized protein n=1 Tax=Candidatus Desulfatifera sulfidica TaxID=2841691 RepID=A0A8J6N734_9BACT|nr:hypothetical protein [Candidatus Desulfatifera sulfidica]